MGHTGAHNKQAFYPGGDACMRAYTNLKVHTPIVSSALFNLMYACIYLIPMQRLLKLETYCFSS